jgi:hypothetical protein
MAEGEGSRSPDEDTDECLHCAIVEMVNERIMEERADLLELVAMIVESLVDVILLAPESDRARLMAHTIAHLGDLYLGRGGGESGGSGSTH